MKTLAIAAALLAAVLLAAPAPASAGGFVSFGFGRPAGIGRSFGYGWGRPSYWGAPPIWAGAYRPNVYPGYYYAPPPVYYAPRPYYAYPVAPAYPLFGPYRSWSGVPVPGYGAGYGGSYYGYR